MSWRDVGSGEAGKGSGEGREKSYWRVKGAVWFGKGPVGKLRSRCEEWVGEVLKGDEVHRVRKGDGRLVVG